MITPEFIAEGLAFKKQEGLPLHTSTWGCQDWVCSFPPEQPLGMVFSCDTNCRKCAIKMVADYKAQGDGGVPFVRWMDHRDQQEWMVEMHTMMLGLEIYLRQHPLD